MFAYIILYVGQTQSLGERVFIGALSGLVFSIFIWLMNKRSAKKEQKEAELVKEQQTKQIQKEIALEVVSKHIFDDSLDYSNLYEELREKCNPSNYMNPYNAEKVEIANSIFSQLDGFKDDVDTLVQLRNQAINKLGLSFSSTALFNKLCDIYNPSNFMGKNYDAEKLSAANIIFAQIQQKKDDIIELERIAKDNNICLHKKNNTTHSQSIDFSKESPEVKTTSYKYLFILVVVMVAFIGGVIALALNSQNPSSPSSNYLKPYLTIIKGEFPTEVDALMTEVLTVNDTYYFDKGCVEEEPFEGEESFMWEAKAKFTKTDVIITIGQNTHHYKIKKVTSKMLTGNNAQHLYCIIKTDKEDILFSRFYDFVPVSSEYNGETENLVVCIDGDVMRYSHFKKWN